MIDGERCEVILRDGTSVTIRAVTPDDRAQLIGLFRRMSPTSVRHRFFSAKRELMDSDLLYLTNGDVALVATVQCGLEENLLGLGRYAVLPGTPGTAEIAFDVGDTDQGRGIGTLLLEHLAQIARTRGVSAFRAEVEADNRQMLEMFRQSGFVIHQAFADSVFHVDIPLDDTERFAAAVATRERIAASHSLRAVFAPRSVAVIGASRTCGTLGRAILDNLIGDRFSGAIYPVNASAAEIAGRRCYPSIAAIDAPVELAIIAVPAGSVESVVQECALCGVRAVVVISAGFAELSATGRDLEHRLRTIARGAGMRMIGPNCMGVLSTAPGIRLNATFSPVSPPAGNVSMVTQSGALGLAMLDHARARGLGIADFASIGNKADVSVNDLLSYWHDDPRTGVIALYLESFGNPRTFARLAPAISRQRPIIAVKAGRSVAGTRAAASHSAALATLDVGIDAVFAQAGVIRTDTLEQLFDVAALLSTQPVPTGTRIGVVTNAGGPGILLADACEGHGLSLPALAPETLAALRDLLPVQAGLANPIDMIASASAAQFEAAVGLVGRDPNVDAVVAIYVPVLVTQPDEVAAAIARGAAALPADKPIAAVFMSSNGAPASLAGGPRGTIPAYRFPENAALALSAAARYGAWRRRPAGTALVLDPVQAHGVRARFATWRAAHPSETWLPFDEIAALLAILGVRVAEHRTTSPDATSVVAAADALGYPVVLKAIASGLVHKTDVGGVALALGDANAVIAAAGVMQARFVGRGAVIEGFLVQRQIRAGVEALVGITNDPSLGPLLIAGVGGIAVELYKDVALHVTPITDLDASDMLDQLRGRALLDGFRGAPPADRPALLEVLQRVSALAELLPDIMELDLNPVVVLERGAGATVADARLRLRAATSAR